MSAGEVEDDSCEKQHAHHRVDVEKCFVDGAGVGFRGESVFCDERDGTEAGSDVIREAEVRDDAEGDKCGCGDEVKSFGEPQCGRDAVS